MTWRRHAPAGLPLRAGVAALGVAALATTFQLRLPQTDVDLYQRYGLATLHSPGTLALPREYPALAGAVFAGVAALGNNYRLTFALAMGAALFALLWIGSSLVPDPAWWRRTLIYLTLGTVGVVAGRFDLLPAIAVLAGVALAARRRWTGAWIAACAGAALKLFPALLLPGFFLVEWRATGRPPWRRAGCAALTALAYAGLQQLLAPGTLLTPFTYEVKRGFEVSSLGATLTALLHPGGLSEIHAFGAIQLVGPHPALIGDVLTALTLLGLLAVWVLAWRRRLSVATVSLAVLTIAILGDKAFAPQYLLWILPLWALQPMRTGWLAAAALTTLVFPYSYLLPHPMDCTLVLAGVRNAVLLVSSARWLRDEVRGAAPAEVTAPTGAPLTTTATRHQPSIAVGGQPS